MPRGLRKHWQVNVQPAQTSRNGPDDPNTSVRFEYLLPQSLIIYFFRIARLDSRLELEQDSWGGLLPHVMPEAVCDQFRA